MWMKVSELVAWLSQFPPDYDVRIVDRIEVGKDGAPMPFAVLSDLYPSCHTKRANENA